MKCLLLCCAREGVGREIWGPERWEARFWGEIGARVAGAKMGVSGGVLRGVWISCTKIEKPQPALYGASCGSCCLWA